MVMGRLDKKVTGTLRSAEKGNAAFEQQKEKEEKRVQLEREMQVQANAEFFEEDQLAEAEQDMDPDFEALLQSPDIPQTRNLHPLPKTAAACDRRNVSDVAGAATPMLLTWAGSQMKTRKL